MSNSKVSKEVQYGVLEKNIPIPSRGPFSFTKDMQVGDSFCVPAKDAKKTRNAIASHCRRRGWKCVSRKVDDGKSLRIWRVE